MVFSNVQRSSWLKSWEIYRIEWMIWYWGSPHDFGNLDIHSNATTNVVHQYVDCRSAGSLVQFSHVFSCFNPFGTSLGQ